MERELPSEFAIWNVTLRSRDDEVKSTRPSAGDGLVIVRVGTDTTA
jgi:hypothetical protein